MKILALCDFYNEDLAYHENLLSKYYQKKLHDVVVVTSTIRSIHNYVNNIYDNSVPEDSYLHKGVKIIRRKYSLFLFKKIRVFKNLLSVLLNEKPDLIFIHNIPFNFNAIRKYAKKNCDVKIVLDFHADLSNSANSWISLNVLHKIFRKYALKKVSPFVAKFYAVTPSSRNFLAKVYGIPADKIELFPLGCDMEVSKKIIDDSKKKYSLKSKYGLFDKFVLVTGGKVEPSKKFDLVINALNALKDSDVYLIIFGDSEKRYISYYQNLIRLAAENNNIIFTGWLSYEEILEHFSISDMALFPGGQSVIWQHAIGMGLPLILSESTAGLGKSQDATYLNLYGNIIFFNDGNDAVTNIANQINLLKNCKRKIYAMKKGAMKVANELLDAEILVQRSLDVFK